MRTPTFLLICIFSVIALATFGQGENKLGSKKQDVVHLKNGGVLRGDIIKMIPDSTVSIEILGKNILVFDLSEVSMITREEAVPFVRPRRERREKTELTFNEKGYYNLSQFGLHIGGQNSYYGYGNEVMVGVQMINGYRFNRLLAIGGGIGFDVPYQGPMMPFFIDIRSDLLKKQITPHFYAQTGYNQPLYNNGNDFSKLDYKIQGGLMAAAGAGIRIHTRGNLSYTATAGFRHQGATETYNNQGGARVKEVIRWNRVSWQVGLMF